MASTGKRNHMTHAHILGGDTLHMKPWETAYIPSNATYRGRTITECKLIDVFSPVIEEWIELEKQQSGK